MDKKISRTLLPGQPGTKKLLDKFGEKLVCVRYKYDPKRNMKLKTVEIIVEESPWEMDTERIPPNKILCLKIGIRETYLRNLVKAAGGKWNRPKEAWELCYKQIVELGLTERIIEGK